MKASCFLGFLLLACEFLSAQKNIMREKIDPRFLQIMDSVVQTSSKTAKTCVADKGTQTKQKTDQKYSCIVYTKNAKALREKGITVNSVLPLFVTAFATLKEIRDLSRMESVTYIEFPANDKLQQ